MSPTELPTAQHKNNLSSVLTEMSAGCPGGLEVSTADQYSQNPRFKTHPLHWHIKVNFLVQNVTIFIYRQLLNKLNLCP
jgi:hypothetical protein